MYDLEQMLLVNLDVDTLRGWILLGSWQLEQVYYHKCSIFGNYLSVLLDYGADYAAIEAATLH